jgi:RiboL-PSP-HEPN
VDKKAKVDTEKAGLFIAEQLQQFQENINRSVMLVKMYELASKESPDGMSVHMTDILRASVVFLHAAFEETLRSLILATYPIADATVLNEIPLAGINKSGRPEKFLLGDLSRFRNKTVDDVIDLSLQEYVSRLTFNNRGDLLHVIRSLGLRDSHVAKLMPALDAMLRRRHQIVHRGDRPLAEDQRWIRATSLSSKHVRSWIKATTNFVAIAHTGAVIRKFIEPGKVTTKKPRSR